MPGGAATHPPAKNEREKMSDRKVVKILKSCVITNDLGYQEYLVPENTINLDAELADDLINGGFANEVIKGKKKPANREKAEKKVKKIETPETPQDERSSIKNNDTTGK